MHYLKISRGFFWSLDRSLQELESAVWSRDSWYSYYCCSAVVTSTPHPGWSGQWSSRFWAWSEAKQPSWSYLGHTTSVFWSRTFQSKSHPARLQSSFLDRSLRMLEQTATGGSGFWDWSPSRLPEWSSWTSSPGLSAWCSSAHGSWEVRFFMPSVHSLRERLSRWILLSYSSL